MGPFTRSFSLLVLVVTALWSRSAFAQLETDTPTFTPTPKFAVTGTPVISTIWLSPGRAASNDEAMATPTPSSVDMGLSDASMGNANDLAPVPTPGSGGQGGSGSGGGKGDNVGLGAGNGQKMGGQQPLYQADQGRQKGQGPRMMELYKAGIQNYKARDYDGAIQYLEQALSIKDKSVPDFYYAEANAMLAVIYKFDRPDTTLAHHYCDLALKIDPATLTAKKLQYEIDSTVTDTERTYAQGMAAYQKCHYKEALPILEQVANTKDPTTPSFYYAEAAKTAGIIYQYIIKDEEKAVHYYRITLKYQPKDELARHNLNKLEAEH